MLREKIRALLLSPAPPLFAMLWPLIAVFLYLSFLGDAGYLTFRARKAELEHLEQSLEELKSEYRNLSDRFLYNSAEKDTHRNEGAEIFLFKFENLPPAVPGASEGMTSIQKSRLFFLFAAVFVELAALVVYARRGRAPGN